jgi:rhodanese-related sulfurtransferase
MNYTTLSPVDLSRLLAITPILSVLDVRTPAEFSEVHVASAKNLPLGDLTRASLEALGHGNSAEPVYLLCHSGKRAVAAADKLAAAGYRELVVITGGTEAWIDAKLPVVRGSGKSISLERQVRITAGALVLAGVLLANFVTPSFIWLSGFVGAGLVFAGLTDFCGMGILLAKAPWNRR